MTASSAESSLDSTDPESVSKSFSNYNKDFAAKLHRTRFIYALYGLLDGVSLSYSMVKYSFDMLFNDNNTSTDKMHDWMVTPGGALAVAGESVFLIAWSMLGNCFDDEDPNPMKRYAALLWGYARISMKAVKNAYKGLRGFLQTLNNLGLGDVRQMTVPAAILVGALSVINRCWARYEIAKRKKMMDDNKALLKEILGFGAQDEFLETRMRFSAADAEAFRARIVGQDPKIQKALYGSAAFGGIVDGLYLYINVLGLSLLAPQLFVAMAALSALFVVGCVVTRVYEEHDYQNRLLIAQQKNELAICGLELEELLLQEIELLIAKARLGHKAELAANRSMAHEKSHFERKLVEFDEKRHRLHSLHKLNTLPAALAGIKDGLAVYSAILSVLFATGTILSLMSVSFPPLLVVAGMVMGLVSVIGLSAFSIYTHRTTPEPAWLFRQMLEPLNRKNSQDSTLGAGDPTVPSMLSSVGLQQAAPKQKLSMLLKLLKVRNIEMAELSVAKREVKSAIFGAMECENTSYFDFQAWSEVFRSFFSGVSKGQKSIDYTLNPLQEQGSDGHYHDTPLMSLFALVSACIHCLGLALRAHARGFGRTAPASAAANGVQPPVNVTPQREPMAIATTRPPVKESVIAEGKQNHEMEGFRPINGGGMAYQEMFSIESPYDPILRGVTPPVPSPTVLPEVDMHEASLPQTTQSLKGFQFFAKKSPPLRGLPVSRSAPDLSRLAI